MKQTTSKKDIVGLIVLLIILLLSDVITKTFANYFSKKTQINKIKLSGLLMAENELRKFKGFENVDDATAKYLIYSMQEVCSIGYEKYKKTIK